MDREEDSTLLVSITDPPKTILLPIKNIIALNKLKLEILLHSIIISAFGTEGIKNEMIIRRIRIRFIKSSFKIFNFSEILEFSKLLILIK